MAVIIQKTFEDFLKDFNSSLRIEIHPTNEDIDVLYHGKDRLCSVPKGLKGSKGWSKINDVREDSGYSTSDDIPHRSLSGVGLVLLGRNLITSGEFVRHFLSKRSREMLERAGKLESLGMITPKKSFIVNESPVIKPKENNGDSKDIGDNDDLPASKDAGKSNQVGNCSNIQGLGTNNC